MKNTNTIIGFTIFIIVFTLTATLGVYQNKNENLARIKKVYTVLKFGYEKEPEKWRDWLDRNKLEKFPDWETAKKILDKEIGRECIPVFPLLLYMKDKNKKCGEEGIYIWYGFGTIMIYCFSSWIE